VRASASRMRVESTFQESTFHDLKRRGWDLEGTVMADRARLDRLLLVVFLGLWWLAHLAASCVHPVSIMGSAPASIAMIVATRASFASDGSGCWISCDGRSLKRASHGAYPSAKPPRDGRSRSASKKVSGRERPPPSYQFRLQGEEYAPVRLHKRLLLETRHPYRRRGYRRQAST
jgi:hypothetical protein